MGESLGSSLRNAGQADVDKRAEAKWTERMEASITYLISKQESKCPLWHFPTLPSPGREAGQGRSKARSVLCSQLPLVTAPCARAWVA